MGVGDQMFETRRNLQWLCGDVENKPIKEIWSAGQGVESV